MIDAVGYEWRGVSDSFCKEDDIFFEVSKDAATVFSENKQKKQKLDGGMTQK